MTSYLEGAFGLAGRVAVVTGGSSGIGLAMAEALSAAGADVVLMARREPELGAAVERLQAAGGRAALVTADLGDRAAIRRAADEAASPLESPTSWSMPLP